MAIEYTTSTFTGSVSAAGGTHDNKPGQPGTLWEPKRFFGLEGSASSPEDITIDESYQYCFTNAAPTNYWNLTLANANWVEFHDGSLHITDLILTNDLTILRFDKNRGETDDFDMESLSITGSIHVSGNASLMLPAEGIYNLSGDLDILSSSIVYVYGNTTVTNEQSGGSAGKEHGIGVTINCQNAAILGTINGDKLGFPKTQGPGGCADVTGATHGGMGGNGNNDAPYGSTDQPTSLVSVGRMAPSD